MHKQKARKLKTIGLIGFSDPWGEQWYDALSKGLEGSGIRIVANEKYGQDKLFFKFYINNRCKQQFAVP